MRLHWLLLGSLGASTVLASPAHAGRLVSWQFVPQHNRLMFQTNAGVQPRAQLISNPTRLVIDLPGTELGQEMVTQSVGGAIHQVRVGQFNAQTTRLVIELAPGFTLDPEQVRFRGETATQWMVQLPTPQRLTPSPPPPSPAIANRNSPPTPPSASEPSLKPADYSPNFQITGNGLFLRLSDQKPDEVVVKRTQKRRIEMTFLGARLPEDLAQAAALAVGRYGIEQVAFAQEPGDNQGVRLTLQVHPESPNWNAFISRSGGIVILPEGGMTTVRNLDSSVATASVDSPADSQPELTTVEALELADQNGRLNIRADGPLRVANKSWNAAARMYQVEISNAQLASPLQGPQLDRNSPIYRIRARQQDAQTVLIQVELAPGVEIEQLAQPAPQVLALPLRPVQQANARASELPWSQRRASSRATTPPPRQIIPVPPPQRPTPPAPTPTDPQEVVLVTVDPGHGGKDPGAIGIGGLREKDVVLPISLRVREVLEQNGVRVQMTRSDDRFVSLAGRSEMANRAGADLFVSIHANAISLSRPDVNGVETFYYSSGRRLAQSIQNSILQNFDMRNRGVKKANFYVLRHSAMPAVLVEVGFVTGREDAPRLADPNFRREMADAIAQGILQYIRQTR